MLYEIAKNGREDALERCANLTFSVRFIHVFRSVAMRANMA